MAGGLGKPVLIRDEDCDVEPLDTDDFEDGDPEEVRLFVIHQAKLCVFCKRNTTRDGQRQRSHLLTAGPPLLI